MLCSSLVLLVLSAPPSPPPPLRGGPPPMMPGMQTGIPGPGRAATVAPMPPPAPGGNSGPDEMDYEARRRNAKFSFEFSKAEIMDVVKAISDMTRQNFIIPERIKGQRITILSPTKITAAEAYQVFYNALSANGIS